MDVTKYCDYCEQLCKRYSRKYKGKRYCGNCYSRVFVKKACPKCNNTARLYRYNKNAICLSCEKNKPCVRCYESGKPLAKLTEYGCVCVSCAPYFNLKEQCDVCGKLTHRLSKSSYYNDDLRRCMNCFYAYFGTCSFCKRYRNLKEHNGKPLCDLCRNFTDKYCTNCKKLIPAGRGKECEDCYWERLLIKRSYMNVELLEKQPFRSSFVSFSKWLVKDIGPQKAALSISRHALFFMGVDRKWGEWPEFNELLLHFGADTLRRYMKIIEWLQKNEMVTIDIKEKFNIVEEMRISRIISRLDGSSTHSSIIKRYERELRIRLTEERITLKTMRLALTPAVALLKTCIEKGTVFPTNKELESYLKITPGQRASLYGFVSFLNSAFDLSIKIPSIEQTLKQRRGVLEKRLVDLIRKPSKKDHDIKWCQCALELFHGVKVTNKSIKLLIEDGKRCNKGITLMYKGNPLFLPLSS